LVLGEVQVFNPETDDFHHPQATAIHEFGDELGSAGHGIEKPAHLFPGEHSGQALGPFRPDSIAGVIQWLLEYLAVKEEDGIEGGAYSSWGRDDTAAEMR
jgi:hypothetical protein